MYNTPTKRCAVTLLSRHSQELVFDALEETKVRPTFEVYVDCSVAELATIVAAAKEKIRKPRAKRMRIRRKGTEAVRKAA